jgi:hypothetical protein
VEIGRLNEMTAQRAHLRPSATRSAGDSCSLTGIPAARSTAMLTPGFRTQPPRGRHRSKTKVARCVRRLRKVQPGSASLATPYAEQMIAKISHRLFDRS